MTQIITTNWGWGSWWGSSSKRIEVTVNTAYDTAKKVWTTTAGNYSPNKWDFLLVNFVNGCSVDNPTLNVDWSGAINIRTGYANVVKGTLALWSTENSNIKALMYYDWTYYRVWSTSNTNTTYSWMSLDEWKAGTATTNRLIRAANLKDIIKYHAVDDTAYWSSWDWKTDIAPSQNAVYDAIEGNKPTYWQILITDLTSWVATGEIDDWALVSGWIAIITLDDTFTGAINSIDISWMDSITVYPQLTNIREWMTGIYISSSENWNELYLFPNTDTAWSGSWDVTWPNSSTDWHLAVFNGATGKVIKDWWAIVDDLTTQSATDVLSANQWYVLKWLIDTLMAQWRFLSLWNCATGLPISFPLSTPYTYITGDYFMVETLDTEWEPPVNYRPNGSSYSGTASPTAETGEVKVWDYYVYDWTVWLLASNHWKDVTFSNIAWQPTDNANLNTALAWKQNNWIDVTVNTSNATVAKVWTTTWGNYTPTKWDWLLVNFVNGNNASNNITLKIDNSASKDVKIWIYWWNGTYMALWNTSGSNVKILMYYDWECYRTWTTTNTTYSAMSVSEWKTGTSTTQRWITASALKSITNYWIWLQVTSWSTAPATPTEWMIWYDTANDKLKTYNWSSWDEAWSGWSGDAKIFTLSSPSDTTTAQAIYDWYDDWKFPFVATSSQYGTFYFYLLKATSTKLSFQQIWPERYDEDDANWVTLTKTDTLEITVSSWTVTDIDYVEWTTGWGAFLETYYDYTTPYTPQYNWSPATKKYVDDNDTVVSGDSWTTYTIKVSNSAPASWTPNTTITFRTN